MSTIFRPHIEQNRKSDRSARDRARHKQKIKNSIKENIADILSEESIIGKNGDKVIKVPLKSIKEYRFIYGENSPDVAQGNGEQKPGDVVQQGKPDSNGQPGKGDGSGNSPGIDAIETEISLEELIELMFEDLELPELERKALKAIVTDDSKKRKGVRRSGIRPRLNKKLTAKNRIKRKLGEERLEKSLILNTKYLNTNDTNIKIPNETIAKVEEEEERFPFHKNDLRYFHMSPNIKEYSNAVVICIMDTSGSMTTIKKYLARSFYFLLYQFIKQKYVNVEVVFIAHHTEAKIVTEEEFFHKVESGGTYISSGYTAALELIEKRFHPSLWNIYAFHCSDGDNFYSDNDKSLAAAQELCNVCNLFGYGEIKPTGGSYYNGTMLEVFSKITADNFYNVVIEKKEDIWQALKAFLHKEAAILKKQSNSNVNNYNNTNNSKGTTA